MKRRTALYLIGLTLLGAAAYVAYDHHGTRRAAQAEVEAAKECDQCSLRHESFARSRKALQNRADQPEAAGSGRN